MFSLWPYLLLAVLATALRRSAAPLAATLLASAALFCAPLLLAAPSAEFRYLLWPVFACLVVAALPGAPRWDTRGLRAPPPSAAPPTRPHPPEGERR